MPTLSVGRTNRASIRGVTLIEMLVVTVIISLMVGISIPAIGSGIDTLRLNAAANSTVSFFNSALNRAERRRQVMEITISKADNAVVMRSAEPGFLRRLEMPDGVLITAVFPRLPEEIDAAPRSYLLYPGGAVPQFGVQLVNRRHAERIVRIDAATGIPRIERPEQ